MRQILQHLKTGELEVAEIPAPQPSAGEVLIQSRATLISPGTERMLVDFSRANLLSKARQKPDKVRQVLDKIKADGLMPTLDAVFRKLGQPLPLGYCNAGVVLETGAGVHDLHPGNRVVSNGSHAEIVAVPTSARRFPRVSPMKRRLLLFWEASLFRGCVWRSRSGERSSWSLVWG